MNKDRNNDRLFEVNSQRIILLLVVPAFFASLIFANCSGLSIGTGGGSSPNEKAPTGTLLTQGTLSGLNGQTVSGNALVYSTGISNYAVRLEGLTAPSEQGMSLQVIDGSDQTLGSTTLTATSGSKNYTFSNLGPNLTIKRIYIFSSVKGVNYGSALLQ